MKRKLKTVLLYATLLASSGVMGSFYNGCPDAYYQLVTGMTVMFPNPADCSSFFSCSNGVPILMHCPSGLHFNDSYDVCDWPQNAECQSDPGATTENQCVSRGGRWNTSYMAGVAGVEYFRCTDSGYLAVGKTTLEGNYEKGSSYPIGYESKDCFPSHGKCCTQSYSQTYHIPY